MGGKKKKNLMAETGDGGDDGDRSGGVAKREREKKETEMKAMPRMKMKCWEKKKKAMT